VLTPTTARDCKECACSYHSDVFSIVGTLFLWIFWPSFNGALAGDAQQRAVINTVLSLVGSAMGGFLGSQNLRGGRFHMEDLQNATLAGGVAIGSAANFALPPVVAAMVGFAAGILSVCGYAKLQSWLES
jgi:ammonium transporter Rh